MMLVVGLAVGGTMILTGGNRPGLAFGLGVALAFLLAGVFRWRVARGMEALERSAARLPEFETSDDSLQFVEATGIYDGLQHAAIALKDRLRTAQGELLQLEALLDSMQDAVVAVDSAGRIQWTNERMQRLMPGNAAGSSVRLGHALVQTIRDPDVLECVRQALEKKTVTIRGATSLMPGRMYEVNASPMPEGGAVAVLHDITRIEEVERTQRDFVANVSHELRTPLTSITGYVETLIDHERGISTQGQQFLATILKNATRMNRLTEDLLVMARVEGPSGELNPMPVRSDALIRDAVNALKGLVQENEAVLEIGAVTQTQVFADPDAMMQVLGNLIENAIKYGQPRNGSSSRVLITARDVSDPYDAVEFSVRDFGWGIASEHLNRIFERFYRVDKTRSRESGGTGLGLAIVRHMVQSQGGTIRAESELGSGSNFLFTLPRALYPVKDAKL
jgi:two-component system phosphate regulon sensor histidine kinase PhoR